MARVESNLMLVDTRSMYDAVRRKPDHGAEQRYRLFLYQIRHELHLQLSSSHRTGEGQ
jgi:hypothetical protein